MTNAFHANLPAPTGQATQIEQSRAIAEVQAAVTVAIANPRNVQRALADMREVCRIKSVAENAFFRFGRGGQQVTGPTVHLARELARAWGNITYGIVELSRNDVRNESEMMASAWDLQTNTRASTTFIVKAARDTKEGKKLLTDERDRYENAANMGARRVREQIFAVLPQWYRDEAIDICNATLRDGGGVPLPQRISQAIDRFGERGVSTELLERKLGRASGDWTGHDLAALMVVWKSIERGETTFAAEFPVGKDAEGGSSVSGADILAAKVSDEIAGQQLAKGKAAESTPDSTPASSAGEEAVNPPTETSTPSQSSDVSSSSSEPADSGEDGEELAAEQAARKPTAAKRKAMFASMHKHPDFKGADEDTQKALLGAIIGRTIESFTSLTDGETSTILAALDGGK